jgi:hypothetical protein
VTLRQPNGKVWQLAVFPDALHLTCDGIPSRTLDRARFVEATALSLFSRGALVIRQPKPRVTVVLNPDALAALRSWLEPIAQPCLAKAVRASRTTALVIGVVSLLPTKHETRPLYVAVGLLWLAWALAVTVKPHRALFLVQAALWVEAGVSCALLGLKGSPLWFAPILFFWVLISGCVRSYRFYGRPA